MFYVSCPNCNKRVWLLGEAAEQTDRHRTMTCTACRQCFEYDDQTIQQAAHDLLPDEVLQLLPALYANEHVVDPIAPVKWFTPDSSWTWFVLEYNPTERLCFGLVIGQERELGYFSVDEIEATRGPMNLRVERDLYWEPKPISQCQ